MSTTLFQIVFFNRIFNIKFLFLYFKEEYGMVNHNYIKFHFLYPSFITEQCLIPTLVLTCKSYSCIGLFIGKYYITKYQQVAALPGSHMNLLLLF